VFGMKNSDIYSFNIKSIFSDVENGFLLDNTPFKNLLASTLDRIGYKYFGDLYIPTIISIVDQKLAANVRLSSTDPVHATLPLLDVLMATTAIPVAFPPGSIPALSKYSKFLDGATGIDFLPVVPFINIPDVKTVYILTYNYGAAEVPSNDAFEFDAQLLENAMLTYDAIAQNVDIGALDILVNSRLDGYIYQPNFTTMFSLTDFQSGEVQYNLTKAYAQAYPPVLVGQVDLASEQNPNYTLLDELYAKNAPASAASSSLSLGSSFWVDTVIVALLAGFFVIL